MALKIVGLGLACVSMVGFINLSSSGPASRLEAQTLAERLGERQKAIEVKYENLQQDMARLEAANTLLSSHVAELQGQSNKIIGFGICLSAFPVAQAIAALFARRRSGDSPKGAGDER